MSQPVKLRKRLTNALIEAGTWMNRDELQARHECSDVALEDALADMVVEGVAEFRPNVGYRLAGTGACRRAAQLMRMERKPAAVVGTPGPDGYRLGVAQHVEKIGTVMYELVLPPTGGDLEALQQQLQGVIRFVNERGGMNEHSA